MASKSKILKEIEESQINLQTINIKYNEDDINNDNYFEFNMTPLNNELYIVDIPMKTKIIEYRIATIYKIYYKDKNGEINTNIRYYLSDGKTNHFRSNLLLPFLCIREEDKDEINTKDNNETNCLLSITENGYNARGLLYKLLACNHLTFIFFENRLKTEVNNIPNGQNFAKLLNENKKQGIGLYSVLNRMINILDFLLAISSNKIKFFNDNYKFDNENLFKDFEKIINRNNNTEINKIDTELNFTSYEKIENQNDPIKIYDESIYNHKFINREFMMFDNRSPHMRNIYRRLLIKLFSNWNKLLDLCKPNINITYEKPNIKEISIENFNKIIETCNINEYTDNVNKNYENYRKISNNLFTKLHNLMMLGDLSLRNLFENLIDIKLINCSNDTLQDSIYKGWKSDCNNYMSYIKLLDNYDVNFDIIYDKLDIFFNKKYMDVITKLMNNVEKKINDDKINKNDYTHKLVILSNISYIYYELLFMERHDEHIELINIEKQKKNPPIDYINRQTNFINKILNIDFFTNLSSNKKDILNKYAYIFNLCLYINNVIKNNIVVGNEINIYNKLIYYKTKINIKQSFIDKNYDNCIRLIINKIKLIFNDNYLPLINEINIINENIKQTKIENPKLKDFIEKKINTQVIQEINIEKTLEFFNKFIDKIEKKELIDEDIFKKYMENLNKYKINIKILMEEIKLKLQSFTRIVKRKSEELEKKYLKYKQKYLKLKLSLTKLTI